ncbi:MAG: hypothetical protein A2270_09140 [Elusimicrobia bacterium RIFOXYA12_FULL_51_18]|nr:MAG: hypothetical protein A2270_09140 [Elusimicrobia bacterium RIFOXYA12_FULL_51_18]OGS32249.1 MAG: hypothetical protein A2218_04025 [Elusimicrobia bacterium RIFOXYA2_FULL_53_38]
MSIPRVLVTGLGPICSLGRDRRAFWDNLIAGRCFAARVGRLEASPVPIGAEAGRLPDGVFSPRDLQLDLSSRFALAAAHRAFEDAGLEKADNDRAGVVIGSSRGAAELLEGFHTRFIEAGPGAVDSKASPYTTAGNLAGILSHRFRLRGPGLFVSAACSSSTQAIGLAFESIRRGRTDIMLAGGTEACLTPFCMAMFEATGILSRRIEEPARACRPFDRDRDGIVIGEGAGMLVLESETHAKSRGAKAYCELRGFGATCDAYSLTGVPENGEGLARAIRLTLEDAGLTPEEIDYINAHGTGTRAGDRAETSAVKTALGERAGKVAISSTKSMTGHLLGAAGGIEAAVCALAVANGVVPPTINLENPDPDCDLDYVPNKARRIPVGAALSYSMGFGGNNACLAFSSCDR